MRVRGWGSVFGGYLKGLNGDLMRRDEFARRESEIGLGVPEGQEDRKSSGHTVGVDGGLNSFFLFPP